MNKHTWWKEAVVYQIYPHSFKDSNGDGIGDLKGIIEKLDYLKWLGIGAVWLCPIYDSPNADMGYDIRNYEAIMSEFGTMEDFDALLDGLHQRGMKLIMDLVVNHSSDEHQWFVEAKSSKDSPFRDYYIWRDGKNGSEPNNWASFFTPSAWSYDSGTNQWYLHLFSEKQPDLNWENPSLREDIYAMINRWLDKGVDGFRMDVISLIAKGEGLPNGIGAPDANGYVFADEHFAFQSKLHEYLREMRKCCFDGRDCMCVGETTFVTTENANSVVGDGRELDMLFQFDLMDIDSGESKWDLRPPNLPELKRTITKWQQTLDWNTLFWGNHDQPRAVSRFGNTKTEELRIRSAKMLATLMYLLRGTPFVYQGEEIGMTNVPFSDEAQLRDIESLNYLSEAKRKGAEKEAWRGILAKGRDNARTPMQWDGGENTGFSEGDLWIMVNPNYTRINVAASLADESSILHYYRRLFALRTSSQTLIYGNYQEILSSHKQIVAYNRTLGDDTVTVICNMTGEPVFGVRLDSAILLSNVENPETDKLLPYEARVVIGRTDS